MLYIVSEISKGQEIDIFKNNELSLEKTMCEHLARFILNQWESRNHTAVIHRNFVSLAYRLSSCAHEIVVEIEVSTYAISDGRRVDVVMALPKTPSPCSRH